MPKEIKISDINNKKLLFYLIIAILIVGISYKIYSIYNYEGCRGYRPYWYNPFHCRELWQGPDEIRPDIRANNDLSQTNGDANTGIEVIVNYEKDKSQSSAVFRIGFSTHVIDYSDYNFNENIVLRDSQNKEYKAANIAKEGSGHHQAIEITFPLVSSPFKLVVKNLAGVPERDFDFK